MEDKKEYYLDLIGSEDDSGTTYFLTEEEYELISDIAEKINKDADINFKKVKL
jgi:hypothetical protein